MFSRASPGQPVAMPVGTTPSPSLTSPANRPPEDVFGCIWPKYVLGGRLVGLVREGEGVVPTGIATGCTGLALENTVFSL